MGNSSVADSTQWCIMRGTGVCDKHTELRNNYVAINWVTDWVTAAAELKWTGVVTDCQVKCARQIHSSMHMTVESCSARMAARSMLLCRCGERLIVISAMSTPTQGKHNRWMLTPLSLPTWQPIHVVLEPMCTYPYNEQSRQHNVITRVTWPAQAQGYTP